MESLSFPRSSVASLSSAQSLHNLQCCCYKNGSFLSIRASQQENGQEIDSCHENNSADSRASLVQALAEQGLTSGGIASFHFPGHSRGAAAPSSLSSLLGLSVFEHDLPELPELDNLFAPQGAIATAQAHAALLFGSDSTFFLVNGSTCGIHASIMATCSGLSKTLILARNSHISAVSAMVISGANPCFIMPGYDSEWDIFHGVDPSNVEKALIECGKDVGAVLITSPTYFGVCSDVRAIAQICHSYNVPLIVDEAHGAHFNFHEQLPETALQQGADIVVQSTHKVLSSLTQSAMLHVQGGMVSLDYIAKCLQIVQSSSPSYLLLASLDAAREHAARHGTDAFFAAVKLANQARHELQKIPNLRVLCLKKIQKTIPLGAVAMDPLRITVGLWDTGLSGFEIDDILRLEHRVIAELPALRTITFAVSSGTTKEDIHSLVDALKAIAKSRPGASSENVLTKSLASMFLRAQSTSLQSKGLTPREAFFTVTERVSAADACGRVSSELVCPYPPGIPLLIPGEKISAEAIAYLRAVVQQGGFVSGASDHSVKTFVVCKC